MRTLEQLILWTLIYFDLFDYPLTNFEVWKYLWNPHLPPPFEGGGLRRGMVGLKDVINELENLVGFHVVEEKDGFYFLPNRAETIQKRKALFQISKRKIDKAKKLVRVFQHIPYLRGIFLCNKVAQGIATEKSDIDLFVIAEKGRTWTVRFFTLFILKVFGLRPKDKKKSDTFCLCFYVDRENLSLEKFMLPPHPSPPSERGGIEGGVPDIHYIYWFSAFLPLYDGGAVKEFITANQWVTKYLPNATPTSESSFSFVAKPHGRVFYEKTMDVIHLGVSQEKLLKRFQSKIMPQELKKLVASGGTNVIISDATLKLHSNDRREEYRKKFMRTLN